MLSNSPPKLCPKIILEGTRLTNKTEVAFKLNEHPRIVGPKKYRYHSPLISAEWCAFTNFPWGRGLVNFNPQEEARAMETYRTWAKLFELLKYYSWIIDRFHISTKVYQGHQWRYYDFRWLEERLSPLGFGIILLTRNSASFQEALEERLKVSGYPAQYDNLDIFIREQEEFRDYISQSLLPTVEIDISEMSPDLVCERIADWLEARKLLGFY
jgi:hypothetical protein